MHHPHHVVIVGYKIDSAAVELTRSQVGLAQAHPNYRRYKTMMENLDESPVPGRKIDYKKVPWGVWILEKLGLCSYPQNWYNSPPMSSLTHTVTQKPAR